jgi:SAM-dependent methyltransferase
MNQRSPERLLGYLQEAVQFRSTVAPFELCRDSQTQWLVHRLSELESEKPVVLDYGCGNLRLLNGVRQRRDLSSRIEYIATDEAMPTLESTSPVKFRFMPPADVRKLRVSSVDAVALMNVLHEVSVEEFTEIVETVRRVLRPTGKLLLVDMAMLPEGEYRAVT